MTYIVTRGQIYSIPASLVTQESHSWDKQKAFVLEPVKRFHWTQQDINCRVWLLQRSIVLPLSSSSLNLEVYSRRPSFWTQLNKTNRFFEHCSPTRIPKGVVLLGVLDTRYLIDSFCFESLYEIQLMTFFM